MEHSTKKNPEIIKGGVATDERGAVYFCNDFLFKNIKRFYVLENASEKVIRAFHGHMKEEKYMFVVAGSAIVCAVEIDNVESPGKENKVYKFNLSSKEPVVLQIPAGFANGSRFLEEDTKLVVFSTSSVEESKGDDYRFPADYWGEDIWKN